MMLAQAKRGEKIERHRRDQIVIFRRTDVRTIMWIAGLQAYTKIFPIVRRRLHVTPLVSGWRGRNPPARLLVYRETQARRASGRIDRCVSVFACWKEVPGAYRNRAPRLGPGPGTLSQLTHTGHIWLPASNARG